MSVRQSHIKKALEHGILKIPIDFGVFWGIHGKHDKNRNYPLVRLKYLLPLIFQPFDII